MNSNKNNKKTRIRPIWKIIFFALACGLTGLLGYGIFKLIPDKQDDVKAKVNVIGIDGQVKNIEETRTYTSTVVKINLESCRVLVGTKFKVTASVKPEGTESSVIWKSSDEKIFKISQEQEIEVVGVGTAALTATIGDVTDAIVIEGVKDYKSNSVMGLPSYDELTNSGTSNNDDNKETKAASKEDDSKEEPTEEPVVLMPGSASSTGETGAVIPTTAVTPTQVTTQAPTKSTVSYGKRSNDIASVLTDNGFDNTGNNVYVYGDGDDYAGQVVLQDKDTIIYIKKNSAEFSNKVLNILEELLPEEYKTVWASYESANTDRGLVVEGRTVRIVTSLGAGHSQIVVYN